MKADLFCLLAAFALVSSACGTSETSRSMGANGGGPSAGGAPAAGNGGSSGSGGSGAPGAGCPTSFGAPRIEVPTSTDVPSSITITADELELFYFVLDRIVVRKRAAKTEPFAAPTDVAELAGVCPVDSTPALEVNGSGLRLYLTCTIDPTPLRLAERPDRNAPFVLLPDPIGMTGTSVSLSADELTLFATNSNLSDWIPLMYQRASVADSFGASMPVPGLAPPFRHPELSADGLTVFGSVPVSLENTDQWRLAMATRATPTSAFSAPLTSGLPAPALGESDYTPTVGADCSSLYFMRLVNPDAGGSQGGILTISR